MPNLINVLIVANESEIKGTSTTQEKRKIAEAASKCGDNAGEKQGMEWGTCMIFSCEKDCCDDGGECWKEEIVFVQWDE